MSTAVAHRPKLTLVAVAGCALAMLGVLALVMRTPTRAAVLAQLSRPAVAVKPRGRAFSTTLHSGRYRVTLALGVNRAGLPDPVRVTVAGRRGQPLDSAHVTLTYSMPSMQMWNVYSSRLLPLARKPGDYGATEGALGMAGTWRIAVMVAMPRAGTAHFAVLDRISS